MNQYATLANSSRTAYSSKLIAAILLLSINLIPTAPVFADFGQGAPTIPNAQPFGIDKQTAKVDASTGAFTQHIALDIPPRGEMGDVAIPPIGTGRGRLELPRKKVIEMIAQSFADASRERVFANKLAIVISADDASKHEVNFFELRDFLTLSLHV